jgi:hypothetical protein
VDFDGADFWDDHTRYEYWNDIEYDTDGYNDINPKKKRKTRVMKSSELVKPKLLKRRAVDSPVSNHKKRKIAAVTSALKTLPPVMLVKKEAMEAKEAPTIDVSRLPSYAILPDWRDKLSDNQEFSNFRSAGSLAVKPANATCTESDEDLLEDEEDTDDEAVEISQDALKRALQQHLGSLGVANLGNIDEKQLLKLMEQMISGEDVKDEMLDQLVDGIHDEDEEVDPSNLSGWISSQIKTTEKDEDQLISSEEANQVNNRLRSTGDSATAEISTPRTAPTRGKKRHAESPNSSPRKKSKNQLDKVAAKG